MRLLVPWFALLPLAATGAAVADALGVQGLPPQRARGFRIAGGRRPRADALLISAVRVLDGGRFGGPESVALATLPEDLDFFAEDAEKMQEAPEYDAEVIAAHTDLREQATSGMDFCAPKCSWSCAKKECDEVCQPHCSPPQCRTLCAKRVDLCETRCGPPQCAVVCPEDCPNGGPHCGKCRTVCSPPMCTDQCGGDCQNVCDKPKCTWQCLAGECPKPECKLVCTGITRCSQSYRPIDPTVPPQYPGADPDSLVGRVEGVASLDPSTLSAHVTPPPLWEKVVKKVNTTPTTQPPSPGPVQALKLKWKAEDKQAEKERSEKRRDEAAKSRFGLRGIGI